MHDEKRKRIIVKDTTGEEEADEDTIREKETDAPGEDQQDNRNERNDDDEALESLRFRMKW